MSDKTSLDSEIRHLSPLIKSKLGSILETAKGWQNVMGLIPGEQWVPMTSLPEGMTYTKKYTCDDIILISQGAASSDMTGFEILLDEWGTSGIVRPRVLDLIALLRKAKLERAASLLCKHCTETSSLVEEDAEAIEDLLTVTGANTDLVYSLAEEDGPLLCFDDAADRTAEIEKNAAHFKLEPDQFSELLSVASSFGVVHYSYSLLKELTDDFSEVPTELGGCRLGGGAFGDVFKAVVTKNDIPVVVAVKKLISEKKIVGSQFQAELTTLLRCSHKNLVTLEGFSCDGPHSCLVYTFISNGNLEAALACSNNREPLNWKTRLEILLGTAEGIVYLHTCGSQPLVHRDIKSANILLDARFVPKIGDFGLVRIGSAGVHTATQKHTTKICGTVVYMAPEAMRGDISVKMDTFSYAVVMLEVLTGLPPYNEQREGRDLLSHVLESDNEPIELLDVKAGPWDRDVALALFNLVETFCEDKRRRPNMVQGLDMLRQIIIH